MKEVRRQSRARGTSILLLLVLLLLIGGLAWWGLSETSTVAPGPNTTTFPDTIPNSPPPSGS